MTQMKHKMIGMLLTCAGCLTGCAGPGYIHVDTLKGVVEPVMARHDWYVVADPELTVQDRADYLRSTELIRKAFDEAGGDK